MKKLNILSDKHKVLRERSEEVTFPLSNEDKALIEDIKEYLKNTQNEELAEKHELRAGWGLSFVQLGKLKRICVLVIEDEENEGVFTYHTFINPKIISHSEEIVYAGYGEGCLSVWPDVEGIVPRKARVTIEAYDEDGKKVKFRAREDEAILVQHELDHMDGILFYDYIDKNDPYKNQDNMRMI